MKLTNIYGFGYLQPGDRTSEILDMDQRRFQALENNLYNLYTIFGNGVLDDDPLNPSWRLQPVPGDTSGTSILITPGHGHIAWKFAKTTSSTILALPFPPGGTYPIKYWIYATPTSTTPDLESVQFVASLVEINNPNYYVGLGAVVVSFDGTNYSTTPLNDSNDGRVNISLFATLAKIINAHHHVGGASEPSPIDLGLHVQGKLSGENIEDLDASTVQAGVFAAERIPQIDHDTLSRRGTLKHSEIDSLLASLLNVGNPRLSDYMVANMLQLGLALKKQSGLSAIDVNLINAILYIPGVTPDSYAAYYSTYAGVGLSGITAPYVPTTIDLATIDKTNHQIVGGNPNAQVSDTIIWTTDTDFNAALTSDSADTSNISVVGSGVGASFTLSKPINYSGITDNDFTKWAFGLVIGDHAATSTHNFNDDFTARRYVYLELGSTEDWSYDDKIGFGFGVKNPSHPGDIYAYLILGTGGANVAVTLPNGSTHVIAMSTPVKIFDHTALDSETLYNQHNLIEFATRAQLAQVKGVGFYYEVAVAHDTVSWDGKDSVFELVVPDPSVLPTLVVQARTSPAPPASPDTTSTIFIWNETLFAPSGEFVFRFNGGSPAPQYNVVNWSASTPTGATLEFSTRVGDDAPSVEAATISLVPTDTHYINGFYNRGIFIDIIVKLKPSPDLLTAPTVNSVILAMTTAGSSMEKDWNTAALWNTGRSFVNVRTGDSGQTDDLILIDDSHVGEFVFLRSDPVNGDDAWTAYGDTETVFADGAQLYQTPWQIWNKSVRYGFESPKDMLLLPNNHVVFADTLNDRVIETDAAGNMIKAIQGNIRLRQISRDFVALSAIYNPRLGKMWIAFSQNTTVADRTKMTIASGQQSISLGDPKVNVILFQPIGGLSATLEVQFTDTVLATVNAWTGPMQVYLGAGSATSAGTSTGGSNPGGSGSSGSGNSGSGGSGGLSSGGGVGLSVGDAIVVRSFDGGPDITTLPTFVKGPPALYRYVGTGMFAASRLGSITGLPEPVVSTSLVGDFNGDGVVDSTFQGPGGQIGSVVLKVFVGEVVYDNLLSPLSIQVTDLGIWVVGSVGASSVNAYDALGTSLWTIPATVFVFTEGKGGSAYLMPNNNVLVAAPSGLADNNGTVLVINQPSGNVVVSRIATDGDAVRALPDSSLIQYWVVLDDVVGDGKRSRLVRINTAGKILWNWGTGKLVHPTGLKILPNGHLLVSE